MIDNIRHSVGLKRISFLIQYSHEISKVPKSLVLVQSAIPESLVLVQPVIKYTKIKKITKTIKFNRVQKSNK